MEKKKKYKRKRSGQNNLPVDELGEQLQPFIWREEGIGRVTYYNYYILLIAGRVRY